MAALLAAPIFASDLEYAPERIKRYPTFNKCVAALKIQRAKDKATEARTVTETEQAHTNVSLTVSEIDFSAKQQAYYTVSSVTYIMAKPGSGLDDGSFGWGIDWSCKGKTMWKGGGHSAYVTHPRAPEPPTPPQAPEAPSP
jgi:hypothetical protein